jgi:hypothetical protein
MAATNIIYLAAQERTNDLLREAEGRRRAEKARPARRIRRPFPRLFAAGAAGVPRPESAVTAAQRVARVQHET